MSDATLPTRLHQPIILIRGFGGLDVEDEKKLPYQGFNDGTVYPGKRGENFIYEGMVLRFLKSRWRYQDATNVVNYYREIVQDGQVDLPEGLKGLDPAFFTGHKIIVDPGMALTLLQSNADPYTTLWVFRYYDLDDRKFDIYGEALLRLIQFIRALAENRSGKSCKVNIIAHSMGGLIVRHLMQATLPAVKQDPAALVNKVITLGTPHQGIAFQVIRNWVRLDAENELEVFNPQRQADARNKLGFGKLGRHFPLERFLTVVGTNYRSYGVQSSRFLNRFFSASGEYGSNYNRSDGLVKQTHAQIPGAPRTFVHKCHGGPDSLITSREAFEIASRFFFGDVKAELRLQTARIKRGMDHFGKSEIFLGVSIKPRGVDFDLFHQSAEAENCYGPFSTLDLSDPAPTFPWAGPRRLIWEGWLDTTARVAASDQDARDMVLRLDFYVGERDLFGIGFSDNLVFRKQYYLRCFKTDGGFSLQSYTGEEFQEGAAGKPLTFRNGEWHFDVEGTGFEGSFCVRLFRVPEQGAPLPLLSAGEAADG